LCIPIIAILGAQLARWRCRRPRPSYAGAEESRIPVPKGRDLV